MSQISYIGGKKYYRKPDGILIPYEQIQQYMQQRETMPGMTNYTQMQQDAQARSALVQKHMAKYDKGYEAYSPQWVAAREQAHLDAFNENPQIVGYNSLDELQRALIGSRNYFARVYASRNDPRWSSPNALQDNPMIDYYKERGTNQHLYQPSPTTPSSPTIPNEALQPYDPKDYIPKPKEREFQPSPYPFGPGASPNYNPTFGPGSPPPKKKTYFNPWFNQNPIFNKFRGM